MSVNNRRERELRERKKLIIKTARDLFFKKGFSNVSVQDICDVAEYGKSSFYALFESKEELYSYVYIESLEILNQLVGQTVFPEFDTDGSFLMFGELYFGFFRDYPHYYKTIAFFDSNQPAYEKIPPKILEKKWELTYSAMAPLVQIFEKAIENDYFLKVECQHTILLMVASINGIIGLMTHLNKTIEEIHEACLLHLKIYLAGLKKK